MTASQLVAAVYLKATGKTSSLVSTDTKYIKILGIANDLIHQWENENGVDWTSLYDPNFALGTVTATDTFAIPATVRKISDARGDFVRIEWTDGVNYTDYDVVPADTLKRYDTSERVCAQIGTNLVFKKAFKTTDAEFGGSLQVPIYTFAPTLSADADVVPVDIPRWLVVMTAAEYVRNDITKQNQYPNLVQEGNALMERMKDDNDAQISEPYMPWGAPGSNW